MGEETVGRVPPLTRRELLRLRTGPVGDQGMGMGTLERVGVRNGGRETRRLESEVLRLHVAQTVFDGGVVKSFPHIPPPPTPPVGPETPGYPGVETKEVVTHTSLTVIPLAQWIRTKRTPERDKTVILGLFGE